MSDESSPQEREAARMAGTLAMPEPGGVVASPSPIAEPGSVELDLEDVLNVMDGLSQGGVIRGGFISGGIGAQAPTAPWLAIKFQEGPIAEVGVNGVQNEDVIDVVIARLEGFQAGEYACEENAEALMYLRQAKRQLEQRTAARRAQGVEGRYLRHES